MKSLNVPLVASFVGLLIACAGSTPPPSTAGVSSSTSTRSADLPPTVECTLSCGGAVLTSHAVATEDHHASAVANIDDVFAAMHNDLLACYRARVAKNPNAHASVNLAIVINPDGTVHAVSSTGGAMLGDAGLRCITQRVERATFAPVYGGGTLHAEVPLSFRRVDTDDTL
jgi:hypothetical protein